MLMGSGGNIVLTDREGKLLVAPGIAVSLPKIQAIRQHRGFAEVCHQYPTGIGITPKAMNGFMIPARGYLEGGPHEKSSIDHYVVLRRSSAGLGSETERALNRYDGAARG